MAEKNCTCKYCGVNFVTSHKRKFCTPKCRQVFYDRSQGIKPKHVIPDCTCKHCGKVFHPKKKDRISYCSRDCAYASRESKPKFSVVFENKCQVCEKVFIGKKGLKYCGKECSKESNRVRVTEYYREKKELTPKRCKCCDILFVAKYGIKRRLFCSDKCAINYARKVSGKTHQRRARVFGVAYESVNPFRVFDRDGWRCQICGKQTPRERRGSCYPNAPELDHRVPMSKGGSHTYSNVQCACRACNGAKSNSSNVGQMPLLSAGY